MYQGREREWDERTETTMPIFFYDIAPLVKLTDDDFTQLENGLLIT